MKSEAKISSSYYGIVPKFPDQLYDKDCGMVIG